MAQDLKDRSNEDFMYSRNHGLKRYGRFFLIVLRHGRKDDTVL